MSRKKSFNSATLLRHVLKPHTALATDLLKLVKRKKVGPFGPRVSSDDPAHRFQIAAIIIFLAGVDKALSLTLELLYLAGRVEWDWLTGRGRSNPPPGHIRCYPGFSAKIDKLKQLGLDISTIQWLSDA